MHGATTSSSSRSLTSSAIIGDKRTPAVGNEAELFIDDSDRQGARSASERVVGTAYNSTIPRPLGKIGPLFLITQADKIAPQVLDDTADGKSASVVILLSEQADVSAAYAMKDQDERGWYVYKTLTKHAERTQAPLKAFLESQGKTFQSFWAANMIVTTADRYLVESLAGRADVARIDPNKPARWIEDPEVANFGVSSPDTRSPEAAEWGVLNVNAPAVWALGFNGTGIVIANQDTGVRWTHNALKPKYRGWNGSAADHNYNWHDAIHSGGGSCGANTVAPCDDNGHGTHTTGTTSGDDGAGNQVGVAPGAKWIGCRNMDQGNGTPATYTECFQFFIAPTDLAGNNPNPTLRPHVMNNSWGCPASEGCVTRAELETIVSNTEAAGIFVEVSAGNSGPGCSTVADAPAIYSSSFSTGAFDISNTLATFSSRGPSTFYTPNLLKPNISAPGVNVRSTTRTSDTSFGNLSGTSMAGPHVTGVVALLWSARPQLLRNIAATKALLQNTANPAVTVVAQTCGGTLSTQIPNNSFGYGRVDALAAVNAAPAALSLSGHLNYQDTVIAARNVTMTLSGSGGFPTQTTTTDANGDYTFTNVPAGFDYTVTPSRAAAVHDLSITSFDASRAARFDASLISLSANQQTAGDTSNNGTCTSFDASQIARYEASIASPGSIAGSWKFVPGSLSYSNLTSSQTNQNLTAILVGDISGNWTPSGPATGPSSPNGIPNIIVSLPVKQDPPGGQSFIPVNVGNTTGQGIGAFSFDISFNQAVLAPQATPFDSSGTLSSGWSVTANTSTPGHLILNAFHTSDLTGQGVLINLKFNVVGGPSSTSALTWTNFTFNEGVPGDTDINGSFTATAPSAVAARLIGQIADGTGHPVAGATVAVQDGAGTRRVITNAEGLYTVENLPLGALITVTPTRANYEFSPTSRSFALLGERTDAVFAGLAVNPDANPLESPEFFVRQQYLDFLGREPDQGGLDYWSGELRACGNDSNCLKIRRVNVSAAFFAEREFQDSGLYIYDLYQGALGRRPGYAEYAVDRRNVVGGPRLEADKAAFAAAFVERTEFITRYPLAATATEFVDALLLTAQQSSGLDLAGSRAGLIALYNSGTSTTESRSLVLRNLVESDQFKQTQYNAAFVLTQYFSYLGRNPDQSGYEFWLNILNQRDRNNYQGMVCSFLTSLEYQRRFSPVVTRSNTECGQ